MKISKKIESMDTPGEPTETEVPEVKKLDI